MIQEREGWLTFLDCEDACENFLAVLEPHCTMSKKRLKKGAIPVIVMGWDVSGLRHLYGRTSLSMFWRIFRLGRRVLAGACFSALLEVATVQEHCSLFSSLLLLFF